MPNWNEFKPVDWKLNTIKAFVQAGFSPAGARVLAAEVGRENDFNPKVMFGSHSDPKNEQTNVGIFSWQKDRRSKLLEFLENKGIDLSNGIPRGNKALQAMAEFARDEMPDRIRNMLSKPNVDYAEANKVVGKDYIRWAYDDPAYAKHHARRDAYFKELGQYVQQPDKFSVGLDWSQFKPKDTKGAVDWSQFKPKGGR